MRFYFDSILNETRIITVWVVWLCNDARCPSALNGVSGSMLKQAGRKFASCIVPVVLIFGIAVSALACAESDDFEFKPRSSPGGDGVARPAGG